MVGVEAVDDVQPEVISITSRRRERIKGGTREIIT